ncbi:MAG: glycosyltransferase family 39 protein [Flavobacteriales bacterium]|nr:glycosyltransferase family 39 protein [Flavobacteriales bacterium]
MKVFERIRTDRGALWLVAGFILLFSIDEGGRILHTRPAPFHIWRQTDCLSLTANYCSGQPFLQPAIYSQIADDGYSGLSAGEFPLIYWTMGQLWKLTGPSEFAYRLFGILLHFLATWACYQALRRLSGSDFWAVTSALLLYTSPVIVYYSMGFLTDVPAFDLVLVGWYFLVRHTLERRSRFWVLAVACFALAALLKVSAGISLVALIAVLAIGSAAPRRFRPYRHMWPGARLVWSSIALAVLAILSWYIYAEWYNDLHNGRYTFNNIWPLWEMTPAEVERAWTWARQVLVFQVFDTSVWVALGLAVIVLVMNSGQLPLPVILLNVLLVVGVMLYTVLWFHALDRHDYYFINPMIALLVPWATLLWWLHNYRPRWSRSPFLKGAFVALLVFNGAYAANNMRMRYTVDKPLDKEKLLPIYHEHEFPVWDLAQYWTLTSTLDMGPALDAMGVGRNARVIFLDDVSINAALYLMDRKGNTNYGNDWSDPDTFDRLKQRGARYLIFTEDHWFKDPVVAPLLKHPVGQHRWAHVFDLREIADPG